MKLKSAWLSKRDLQSHTLITGGTGSGKSETLKVLTDAIKQKFSESCLVIIDPHGDTAEQIAKIPGFSDNTNLIYFDPTLCNGYTPCINPLEVSDTSEETIDTVSQELAKTLDALIKDSQLSTQMKAVVVPCIATLLKREGSTLADLQRFMNDDENDDLVELGRQSDIPAHRYLFQTNFKGSNYTATKRSIYTKLQSILNSQIFYRLTVGPSTINLDKVLDQKGVVIFSLSKGKMSAEASEAFGRFLVSLIQSHAMKRAKQNIKDRLPTFLIIDEFQNYVNDTLKEMLAETRKYHLHCILACQMLGQNTTTEIKNALLTNTAIKVIGKNSVTTLRQFAAETRIPIESMQDLKRGEFFIKTSEGKGFKFYTPSYLVDNHKRFPPDQWKTFIDDQLSKYYRHATFNPQTNEDIQNHKPLTNTQNKDGEHFLDHPYINIELKPKRKKQ